MAHGEEAEPQSQRHISEKSWNYVRSKRGRQSGTQEEASDAADNCNATFKHNCVTNASS